MKALATMSEIIGFLPTKNAAIMDPAAQNVALQIEVASQVVNASVDK